MATPVPDESEAFPPVGRVIPLKPEQPPPIGEEISRRPARALMGWIEGPEAVNTLLGRTPLPTDDLPALEQEARAYRTAVAERSPFHVVDPIQEVADQNLAASITSRPDIQAAFAGLQWCPAFVNLKEVLSFQKVVNIDGLDERIAPALHGAGDLLDLCLPTDQPLPPQGALIDQDQKGLTVSSLNPNLRVLGVNLHDAQVNVPGSPIPTRVQAATFFFSMGTSYLSVARYQGRCFVRDGYHRAAGLLRAGVEVVPCILVEARSVAEIGCPPGSLPYDVLFGERPPHILDFWDDRVARIVMQPAIRKGIRFRGDEFVVVR